ncbi:MAG: DUF615 domain-containing protein [Gammaproteobacteria bacterium]|nr:DUF615 domain-containing protein [Gammaproteobacteria bacterium]
MEDNEEQFDELEVKSRTQKKHEAEALQVVGARLLELTDSQLMQLDLPEQLFDSIKLAQTIDAHGGKKRQLQFIGKLMRDENLDISAINDLLARLDGDAVLQIKAFKALEQWRDKLVDDGDSALTLLLEKYPQADVQQIRQHIRNANNKKNEKLVKKSKKAIFQYIKQLSEEKQG